MNYTTTTTTAEPESLTIDRLREVMETVQKLGPEPIGEYMKREGFDPEKGGRLLLPMSLRDRMDPVFVPWYVAFSRDTDQPILYWDFRYMVTASVPPSTRAKSEGQGG